MAAVAETAQARSAPDWVVVLQQELRDLWLGGRGLVLSFGFSLLLSVIAYLTATNSELNFLEQRESVSLTLQVAIAVGALLALLAGADAVSGERERGSLETLLLTPVSRRQLATGKLLAAVSLWLAAFAISVPYVWFLGRGIGLVSEPLVVGFLVGSLLAVFLASVGIVVSLFTGSNRVSLALCLFILLALFLPNQLPSPAQKGWFGELLLRLDPLTAGVDYVGKVLVNGHRWTEDISLLASPVVAAGRVRSRGAAAQRALPAASRRRLDMRPRRRGGTALVAVVAVLLPAPAASAADASQMSVTLDRARVSTQLGQKFSFRSTITNRGSTPASGLIAHLNVLSLRPGVYVDPEDWSPQRTVYLRTIAPGGSTTTTWRMHAVNAGHLRRLRGRPRRERPSASPAHGTDAAPERSRRGRRSTPAGSSRSRSASRACLASATLALRCVQARLARSSPPRWCPKRTRPSRGDR